MSAPLNVFITDGTTARTTRHLMLLLMALSSENPDITAECAVPFWYAPFVPKWCFPAIRELIGPLIQDCDPKNQEEGESLETGIRRNWSFEKSSLETVMTGHVWVGAKAILNPCPCWGNVEARFAQHLF